MIKKLKFEKSPVFEKNVFSINVPEKVANFPQYMSHTNFWHDSQKRKKQQKRLKRPILDVFQSSHKFSKLSIFTIWKFSYGRYVLHFRKLIFKNKMHVGFWGTTLINALFDDFCEIDQILSGFWIYIQGQARKAFADAKFFLFK